MTKVYFEDNLMIGLLPIIACLAGCNIVLLILCVNCFKKKFKSSDEDVLVDNQENVAVNVYAGIGDLVPPSQSTPAGSVLTGNGDDTEDTRLFSGFPRSQLNYVAEVGRGWFGMVLLGEAHKLQPGIKKTKVVIKQLRDSASQEEQNYFLQEVQPFRELKHANILPLMGQCTDGHPLLLILEYCALGDLKGYLLRHAIDGYSISNQGNILLSMACDMASGLQCMHEANLIHSDFATRNCLVSIDITIKVGDYGISQDKYKNDYYITDDGMSVLPVRWLAPETVAFEEGHIEAKGITKESNVWSFGIALWEVLQFAQRPYPNLSDEQVIEKVLLNQVVKPTKSETEIKNGDRWYEIMQSCYLDAKNRPSMKDVHSLLVHLKDQINDSSSPQNIADFDKKWNSLVPTQIKVTDNNQENNENLKLINKNFESNFVKTNEEHDSVDFSSEIPSQNNEKVPDNSTIDSIADNSYFEENLLANHGNQMTDDNLHNNENIASEGIADTTKDNTISSDELKINVNEKNTLFTTVEIKDNEANSYIQRSHNIDDKNTSDHNIVPQLTVSVDVNLSTTDDQAEEPADTLLLAPDEKIQENEEPADTLLLAPDKVEIQENEEPADTLLLAPDKEEIQENEPADTLLLAPDKEEIQENEEPADTLLLDKEEIQENEEPADTLLLAPDKEEIQENEEPADTLLLAPDKEEIKEIEEPADTFLIEPDKEEMKENVVEDIKIEKGILT